MISTDKLTVIDVPGSHNTIVRHPNVNVLAKKFAETIQSSEVPCADKKALDFGIEITSPSPPLFSTKVLRQNEKCFLGDMTEMVGVTNTSGFAVTV